eukprot:GEMP01034437.1.p1 GENE.GEMP01034437.1~~GEMP01034437.1.p1  ORF type:complete len:179 (+),score=22.08 GEMP01034437.1:153-689(+)
MIPADSRRQALNHESCLVVMNKYDKNRNGRLELGEVERLIRDFCGPAISKEIDAKSVMGLADLNNSKSIEVGEVSQLLRSLDIFIREDTQQYLTAIWIKYDKDKSKLLDKGEIGQILTDLSGGQAPTGRAVDEVLRKCSKDGDLCISKYEFMYVLSAWFTKDVCEQADTPKKKKSLKK